MSVDGIYKVFIRILQGPSKIFIRVLKGFKRFLQGCCTTLGCLQSTKIKPADECGQQVDIDSMLTS